MKVDRGRIAEALRAAGKEEAAAVAHRALQPEVDTVADRAELLALGLDPDELLELLGPGGLGKMIGG